MDWTILIEIGKGVLVGATVALTGFIKNLPDGAAFEWMKAAPVLIIGAITGIVANLMHIDLTSAGAILASYGVVAIINQLWSALLKHNVNKKVASMQVK